MMQLLLYLTGTSVGLITKMRMRMRLLLLLSFTVISTTATSNTLVPPDSELTIRTTSSVDMQVCAPPGLLSDRRDAIQALCLAQLRYLLDQTTAVYLVRQSTTALGAVCWVYVYQAPSPAAAALTEHQLSVQTGLGKLTLTDPADGQAYLCTTHVVPWQGESPPLSPYWDLSASDLIFYGGIAGGALALFLLVLCCFVVAAQSVDARRYAQYQHHHRQQSKHHQVQQHAPTHPSSSSASHQQH